MVTWSRPHRHSATPGMDLPVIRGWDHPCESPRIAIVGMVEPDRIVLDFHFYSTVFIYTHPSLAFHKKYSLFNFATGAGVSWRRALRGCHTKNYSGPHRILPRSPAGGAGNRLRNPNPGCAGYPHQPASAGRSG